MKALSLWQPYATLMAIGAKTVETRDWPTHVRGTVAIAATANTPRRDIEIAFANPRIAEVLRAAGYEKPGDLPTGAILCLVDLVDCKSAMAGFQQKIWTPDDEAFGDLSLGRYGFITSNRRQLPEPIPFKGGQKWKDVPPETLLQIAEQVPAMRHHAKLGAARCGLFE